MVIKIINSLKNNIYKSSKEYSINSNKIKNSKIIKQDYLELKILKYINRITVIQLHLNKKPMFKWISRKILNKI